MSPTSREAEWRSPHAPGWQADHHMHLASADICKRVGGCISAEPFPVVFGVDAIQALDQSGISKGVAISSAYLYGLKSLELSTPEIARWMRQENEFTAAEVLKNSDRLIGFLSLDPLQLSALDEFRHWQGSSELIGLKLHLTASSVNIGNADDRDKVAEVISYAAAQGLPLIIHIGGGRFDASSAELFIRTVLPSAGQSWVQIAHAGGGLPLEDDNHAAVLRVFADHISRNDPLTDRVLFDLSYVPAPEESDVAVAAMVSQMRRIGINRFLFGSDYNVLTPAEQIAAIRRLRLTDVENDQLRQNCAPWVCNYVNTDEIQTTPSPTNSRE